MCAGALAATASAVLGAPDQFRGGILQGILPGVFDRLGDAKAPVRDAGRDLFLALMSLRRRARRARRRGVPAWRHKNWRVREEAGASPSAPAELDREIEPGSCPCRSRRSWRGARALEDREPAVREAVICAVVAAEPPPPRGRRARLLQKHTVRPGR